MDGGLFHDPCLASSGSFDYTTAALFIGKIVIITSMSMSDNGIDLNIRSASPFVVHWK